jgi:hypothetical protein
MRNLVTNMKHMQGTVICRIVEFWTNAERILNKKIFVIYLNQQKNQEIYIYKPKEESRNVFRL